ncbi:MAG TPA: hypothetical protein DEG88_02695, partial [Propionibacteriaceae bacterium]|nr:hypothetical protein [Propionibacteriaceae bacterium]
MLIGLAAKNGILIVEFINQLRDEGVEFREAILTACEQRLRPIIMTALATIMALIPMSLGITGGGVFVSKPLAIVVIGGLVSSTLLTLILVPVLYDMVEGGREKLAARRAKRKAAREAVPADADPAVADPVVDSEVDPAFDPDAVTQA